MDNLYLENKVHALERKISDLEWRLSKTASDAHWELSQHKSNVSMASSTAFAVFFITVNVLLVLILR
ncbi:MAG TPA: hypothetical protein VKA06_10865 [Spirochaetia bacterium]|nr:hypothetical protein [Spirochaetia bacterium]